MDVDGDNNWKQKIIGWAKRRSFYFWIIIVLAIVAIVILLMERGDYEMGDLSMLDDEHLEECRLVLDEEEKSVVGLENLDELKDKLKLQHEELIETSFVYTNPKNKGRWKREEICRNVFENIYQKPFKSCRPDFLKNPKTGRNLELDGYNDELEIAFEHNGKHHYEFPNTFHRTKEDFMYQLKRDKYKRKTCDDNGVYLINIPYHINTKDIRTFIISKLPKDF